MRNILNEPPIVGSVDARIRNIAHTKDKVGWGPSWQIRRFENRRDHKAPPGGQKTIMTGT